MLQINEKGQGLTEYALILVLVAVVMIAVIILLGVYFVVPVLIPWLKDIWEAAMIIAPSFA